MFIDGLLFKVEKRDEETNTIYAKFELTHDNLVALLKRNDIKFFSGRNAFDGRCTVKHENFSEERLEAMVNFPEHNPCLVGCPDLLAVVDDKEFWVEVKTKSYNLTENQVKWLHNHKDLDKVVLNIM